MPFLPSAAQLHRHLIDCFGLSPHFPPHALPINPSLSAMAEGLAAAWLEAGSCGAVLFVVQPGERNVFDQQWLQARLWETHRIVTLRRTLAQCAEASVGPDGALTVDGQAVSVVYFRAGCVLGVGCITRSCVLNSHSLFFSLHLSYTPVDYPSEKEWTGREVLERSNACKCPSVGWHLAGAKKVQQELARPVRGGCLWSETPFHLAQPFRSFAF